MGVPRLSEGVGAPWDLQKRCAAPGTAGTLSCRENKNTLNGSQGKPRLFGEIQKEKPREELKAIK